MPLNEAEKAEQEKRNVIIGSDKELKDLNERVKVYAEIEAFSKSKGGEKLVKSLEFDITETVFKLTVAYKSGTHIELIALCSLLESKLDLLRRMTNSGKNKQDSIDGFNERLQKLLSQE